MTFGPTRFLDGDTLVVNPDDPEYRNQQSQDPGRDKPMWGDAVKDIYFFPYFLQRLELFKRRYGRYPWLQGVERGTLPHREAPAPGTVAYGPPEWMGKDPGIFAVVKRADLPTARKKLPGKFMEYRVVIVKV